MGDWPDPYLPPVDDGSGAWNDSPLSPGWRRPATLAAGKALALKFIDEPVTFANAYRDIVLTANTENPKKDHVQEYLRLVLEAYPNGSPTAFNSNDFANVHHATWLFLGCAFACLNNYNPHGDWGDPPPMSSVHPTPASPITTASRPAIMYPEYYHFVPNPTGYYAMNSADVGAPNTGA